ncbi:hypothetical protein [Ensifer sp. LC163]|uniref:hypothetical protein n=1 Tax=Ensifer sp. LC163 TaxID=1120652 RepID=UPI0008137951|nr:hypothetical protein [Ensifer sp. LC163]OCP37447.1 hypothetical protein BC360_23040 [Ensifer sp. LC163]
MLTSTARFALPTTASELCIEVPGAAYVVRRLAERPALGQLLQTDDGDLIKFVTGGKITMWTRGKRLFLLVEASDLLTRIAIEDVLAVELSSIHPTLPTLLLWHAAKFKRLQSPHVPEHGRTSVPV